ncbi:MAG: SoxR reducing system RseC family protein [Dethiobacteria bacterium]|jgi:sigma-E factor negative regulatory protein RseC
MEQFGQVMELVENNKALVKVQQHSACAGCGACKGFFGDPEKKGHLLVEVMNPIGAQKGEVVRLEARSQEILFAAFLLYLLPVLALLAGLFAGRGFAISRGLSVSPDLGGLALGLTAMVSVFLILRGQEKNFQAGKRFKAVITSVVSESEWPLD